MRFVKAKWLFRIAIVVLLASLLSYTSFTIYLSNQDCPFWLRNELAHVEYRLIFTSNRDGNYKTYVMNADGSQPTEVSQFPPEQFDEFGNLTENDPIISPDGQHVALLNNGLWITDRDLTTQQRLVHPAVRVTGFNWSPDGRFLAIAEGVLTVTEIERQTARSLNGTGFVGVSGIPRWSPDGRHIAFEIRPPRGRDAREVGLENWKIYVLDVNTFQPCLLTTNQAYSDRNPVWR